jgi:putative transposase
MPNYRRVKIKGGTYFFTLITNKRQRFFTNPEKRELLGQSINHVKTYHPFLLVAYCILPDHIHLILRLPEDDDNFSLRISEIKKRFSKLYTKNSGQSPAKIAGLVGPGESGLWQQRFWEHTIRDEEDLHRHIDYIHYNPVKHGLVQKVKDWPSSSFFDYVKAGNYEIDWGESYQDNNEKHKYGE